MTTKQSCNLEQLKEIASEAEAAFQLAAIELEQSHQALFSDPKTINSIYERYDKLAQRLFEQNCGEPWKHREECAWATLRAAIKQSSNGCVTVRLAGEGKSEALCISDDQGNQNFVTALGERMVQESWKGERLLEFLDQNFGELVGGGAFAYDRLLLGEDNGLAAQAGQVLLTQHINMLAGRDMIRHLLANPGELKHLMDVGSIEQARNLTAEMVNKAAAFQVNAYKVLGTGAFFNLFNDLSDEASHDTLSEMAEGCAEAVVRPAVFLVEKGVEMVNSWLNDRKTH